MLPMSSFKVALKREAEAVAAHLSAEYVKRVGKEKFPRDAEVMADVADVLFGLQVVYDDKGVLNQQYGDDDLIIGCLFPDGHPSPWGKDKLVVVNVTPPKCCQEAEPKIAELNRLKKERGEKGIVMHGCNKVHPATFNQNHTIGHEVIGHYACHYLKNKYGHSGAKPVYCRSSEVKRKPPMEWQADYATAEFLMPKDKVAWILDGQQPGAIIDVNRTTTKRFREYFNASQAMMELRLVYLDYKLINPKYEWADYTKRQAKRENEFQKQIRTKSEAEKLINQFTDTQNAFQAAFDPGKIFDEMFKGWDGFDIFGSNSKKKN